MILVIIGLGSIRVVDLLGLGIVIAYVQYQISKPNLLIKA